MLPFIKKDSFIEEIHKAKFKNVPSNYKSLNADEIMQINKNPGVSQYMPQQEKGIRPSCALPYELYADGNLNSDKSIFEINLTAANNFIKEGESAPFLVYARNYTRKDFIERAYAATAGDTLKDNWDIKDFEGGNYHLEVYGPNGFYRKFIGNSEDALISVSAQYETDLNNKLTGNVKLNLKNDSNTNYPIEINDNSYSTASINKQLDANSQQNVVLDLSKSFNWYDFSVRIDGNNAFEKRYAGHVETGKESKSDPAMGGL
jgi:phospholipase C